jgi:tRNA nucleotidyltransferase (CCA-adding enzyme)
MILVPPELARILRQTPELRTAFLVGGCVRDALLGHPGKDYDVEVFGVGYEELAQALSRWGRVDLVGQSFGVVKLTTGGEHSFDFTIPRRDSKIAAGHKGFAVEFDPSVTPAEAAARRDFTINSLMFDPRAEKILDFFGGERDLQQRILRHTSPAFVEDPLRVLRGMQFAGRFNLTPAHETIELCRQIKGSFAELAGQRVRDEWFKWAEKSGVPSAGLKFLAATQWIEHFPEIRALIGTPQEPEWHPEGDVFIHTCHCCDAMSRLPAWRSADPETRIVLMLAILAHDFGKPATTHEAVKDGRTRIVSPGHDALGGDLAKVFLGRRPSRCARPRHPARQSSHPFSNAHRPQPCAVSPGAWSRKISKICASSSPPTASESARQLLAKARELRVQEKPPAPILMGRHLIDLGTAKTWESSSTKLRSPIGRNILRLDTRPEMAASPKRTSPPGNRPSKPGRPPGQLLAGSTRAPRVAVGALADRILNHTDRSCGRLPVVFGRVGADGLGGATGRVGSRSVSIVTIRNTIVTCTFPVLLA